MSLAPLYRPTVVGTAPIRKDGVPPSAGRGEGRRFVQVLSEARAAAGPRGDVHPVVASGQRRTDAARAAQTAGGTPAIATPDKLVGLRALADRALAAEKEVEALVAAAGRGGTFSAAELIALQATVFRYAQTVEVISRATDRLVGAVKQTLGTQV